MKIVLREQKNEYVPKPFDGIFNVMAINGILDTENIYSFALRINKNSGFKINVVDENTIVEGKFLKELIEKNIYIQRMLDCELPYCIICDYLRLMLICDYGYNNFIDLDFILNKEILNIKNLEEYSLSKKNCCGFLMSNLYTFEMYFKYKKYLHDGIFIQDYCYDVKNSNKILDEHFFLQPSNNLFHNEEFVIVVIDGYDQRLFEINKNKHVKIISTKNINRIYEFYPNIKDKNFFKNAKYIDIEGNEFDF